MFFVLKIMADMLYQFKLADIFLSFIGLIIIIFNVNKENIQLCFGDVVIVALFFLFSISFIKDISYYFDYFKISSAFLLYFIGRLNFQSDVNIARTLKYGFFLILYINAAVCFAGLGTKIWGHAETFSGLYYFKTDFALMLSFFLVFWLYSTSKHGIIYWISTFLSLFLIFMCNSRIFYLIVVFILYFHYLYKKGKKIFNLRHLILLFCLLILTITLISNLNQIPLFRSRHFISLGYSSFGDLFNQSNMQGRNIIWNNLLSNFNQQPFFVRIFGAGLGFNYLYGIKELNEHSLYIKLIINTGYFGLFIWLLFVLYLLKIINKTIERKNSFITLSLLIIFLIQGISVPTILFTDSSWIPMFFFGCCISKYSGRNTIQTREFSFSKQNYFKCTNVNCTRPCL